MNKRERNKMIRTIDVAKAVQMTGVKRWVNIRGYLYHVTLTGRKNKDGEYIVMNNGRKETVPEHLFYHTDSCAQMILRDSVEFKREYPNHPIEIEKLPY